MNDMLKQIPMPLPLGGVACLNFINTIEYRGTETPIEFLHSYSHVIVAAHDYQMISEAEFLALADQQPTDQLFHAALDLREALYQIFMAHLEGREPDLTQLNHWLSAAGEQRIISAAGEGFAWRWRAPVLEIPLYLVALSAAELLTGAGLAKVRQCPNCRWLFLDTSRNGLRRWCSMDHCGSQVKSRRQYARKQQAKR